MQCTHYLIQHHTVFVQLYTSIWLQVSGKAIPFCVVVNEHVILHRQLKVRDLLTHPTSQRHKPDLDTHLTHGQVQDRNDTYRMVSIISCAASWCLSCREREKYRGHINDWKLNSKNSENDLLHVEALDAGLEVNTEEINFLSVYCLHYQYL